MASTVSFDAYNPGNGFTKNLRSFSSSSIPNPAHSNVLKPHDGDDWGTGRQTGVDVRAAADGVVVRKTNDETGYGNYLVIEHTRDDGSKFRTLYAHMAEASPYKVGDTVSAGATIGDAGSTGGSTGIHLHFEVIDGGGKSLPAGGSGRLDPATFDQWGGVSHTIGTDAAGNALIARSSGSIQDGDYSRIVLVKDKATGAVLDTYGQTFTALKNSTGETEAFRITNKTSAGQAIVIDTVTPNGEVLRHEVVSGCLEERVCQSRAKTRLRANNWLQKFVPLTIVGALGFSPLAQAASPVLFENHLIKNVIGKEVGSDEVPGLSRSSRQQLHASGCLLRRPPSQPCDMGMKEISFIEGSVKKKRIRAVFLERATGHYVSVPRPYGQSGMMDRPVWQIVDGFAFRDEQIPGKLPNTRKPFLEMDACELAGQPNVNIVAIGKLVYPVKGNYHITHLNPIYHAWRVDEALQRFVKISADGIECVTNTEGHD